MSSPPDTWTEWLFEAQRGDRISLAALIRAAQPDVVRLASNLVAPAEAEDITQEAFLRMYRALPSFRGESSARTWIMSIARLTCIDAVRSRRRRRRLEDRIASERNNATIASSANHVVLAALISSLTDEQREAVVLTQVVGCSYEEAAAICGVAIGTIRSRIARARATLVAAVEAAG